MTKVGHNEKGSSTKEKGKKKIIIIISLINLYVDIVSIFFG